MSDTIIARKTHLDLDGCVTPGEGQGAKREQVGKEPDAFPHALGTMFLYLTDD